MTSDDLVATTRPYEEIVLTAARDRLDALVADASDPPRSNSKNRTTTIVRSVAAPSRKMSDTQLRVFFLLCVAVYFIVICFADEIVRCAQWMSDHDDVTNTWKAVMTTTTTPTPTKATVAVMTTTTTMPTPTKASNDGLPTTTTTPTPTKAPISIDATKQTLEKLEPTTVAEKKAGHLRGEVATVAPTPITKEEAPTPAAIEKAGGVASSPPPPAADATNKSPILDAVETGGPKPTPTTVQNVEEDAEPTPTTPQKIEHDAQHADERDAPLDSVEERETRNDKTEKMAETHEALAAPAEIPMTVEQPSPTPVVEMAPVGNNTGVHGLVTAAPTPVVNAEDAANSPEPAP